MVEDRREGGGREETHSIPRPIMSGITYDIKYVDRPSDGSLGSPGERLPVIVAPHTNSDWSYSAAVATFNALLLKNKVEIPRMGDFTISSDDMVERLGEYM